MLKKSAPTDESSSLERRPSSANSTSSTGSDQSSESRETVNKCITSTLSACEESNDEDIDWSKKYYSKREKSVASLQNSRMKAHVGTCDLLCSLGESQTAFEMLHYGLENEKSECGSRARCLGIIKDSDETFDGFLGNELQSKHDSALDFPASIGSIKKDSVSLMIKELAEAFRSSHFHQQTQTVLKNGILFINLHTMKLF